LNTENFKLYSLPFLPHFL